MKIIFIAGTIFELYYLSAIAYLLKSKDKSLEIKLLLRYHFEKNITPEIKNIYSSIELFEIPPLTFPLSKNPLKVIYNFFENFYLYIKFRKLIKKVSLDADIICIAGFKEFFANVMCRLVPKKVRLIAIRLANQKLDNPQKFIERPFFSFLLNIKNLFFGCSSVIYKFRTDSKNELITKNFIKYPYHRTISITDYNIGKKGDNYRLPPPLVSLKKIFKVNDEKPAILLAGDRTPLYPSWDDEDQKKYEEFLDYLRNNFKSFKLYFKPKMGKTDPKKYNLSDFEVLDANVSLEEICLRNNIFKVISSISTSSKVGVYFGIPGYLLYPLFKTPIEFRKIVEDNFDDVQSVVKMKKFEDLMIEPELFIKKYNFDNLASLYWEAIIKK